MLRWKRRCFSAFIGLEMQKEKPLKKENAHGDSVPNQIT